LRRRQSFETVEQSRTQLMEAGEGKLHFPLHPGCSKDPAAIGPLGGVFQ
jgi:hypothetical protein